MDLEWRCESLGYDGASDVRHLRGGRAAHVGPGCSAVECIEHEDGALAERGYFSGLTALGARISLRHHRNMPCGM